NYGGVFGVSRGGACPRVDRRLVGTCEDRRAHADGKKREFHRDSCRRMVREGSLKEEPRRYEAVALRDSIVAYVLIGGADDPLDRSRRNCGYAWTAAVRGY